MRSFYYAYRYISAKTGRYVTESYANRYPHLTVKLRVKMPIKN